MSTATRQDAVHTTRKSVPQHYQPCKPAHHPPHLRNLRADACQLPRLHGAVGPHALAQALGQQQRVECLCMPRSGGGQCLLIPCCEHKGSGSTPSVVYANRSGIYVRQAAAHLRRGPRAQRSGPLLPPGACPQSPPAPRPAVSRRFGSCRFIMQARRSCSQQTSHRLPQLNWPPPSPSYLAQAVLQLVGWGIGKALVDLRHVTT